MSEFDVGHEPPRQPASMEIVGAGVILSCLLLSGLFGWGIYLDLTQKACVVEETTVEAAVESATK
jgi:hypothetical protein